MRLWIKISLWVVFAAAIVYFLNKVENDRAQQLLTLPQISIRVKGENAFINKDELLGKLKRKQLIYAGQTVAELDVEAIEDYIRSISQVKNVDVFSRINGEWKIDVELRKPVVRVFNKYNQSFYLDEDGYIMHTTPTYTARVPVASGDIGDRIDGENVPEIINNDSLISIRKLDEIYWISNYVCNDPLFQSLISQIYVERNGDVVLTPLVGDQKIIFGPALTGEEVEKKFGKLKIFYKEAMPYEGWKKYETISLKYAGQIVCKKKENQ